MPKRKASSQAIQSKRPKAVAAPVPAADVVAGTPCVWGQNTFGQMGLGLDVPERKFPTKLPPSGKPEWFGGKAVKVAVAGGMHSLWITEDGLVYTAGCNDESALGRVCVENDEHGLDSSEVEGVPFIAEGLEGTVAVQASGGDSHSAVLTDDGRVFACGTFRDPSGSFAFSDKSLKAKTFTQIYPPLGEDAGAFPPGKQIDSGADHMVLLAKSDDGSTAVFTYGSADQGQLGRVAKNKASREGNFRLSGPADPAMAEAFAGRRSTLGAAQALLRFHQVSSSRLWGKKTVTSVHAGGWSTAVVDEDGRVFAWGLNNYGQLGQPSLPSRTVEFAPKRSALFKEPIKTMSFGQHHCVALTATNKVLTIGRGDTGQLGVCGEDGEPLVESGAATCHVDSFGGASIASIATGGTCSFAITEGGDAFSWGFGENLQLASGVCEDRATAEPLGGQFIVGKPDDDSKPTRSVLQIAAGGQHTLAIAKER